MRKLFFAEALVVLLVACIPFMYLSYVYAGLSESVPVHFDMKGHVNEYTSKKSLWLYLTLLAGIAVAGYLIIANLNRIDPKKATKNSPLLLRKIAITFLLIITATNMFMIYTANGELLQTGQLVLVFQGAMIFILGNFMYSIKPNYLIGFRIPWTMKSNDNWRKTHQLVGVLWVPAGILLIFSSLFLQPATGGIIFPFVLLIIVAIPVAYSYIYYKKHQNK